MKKDLFRIVYCSRNLVTGLGLEQKPEVARILDAARKNNSTMHITGALLYDSRFFAQVLEGPQGSIEKVFEKIQCDRRHGDVAVLECSPAAGREFPDWSMAHARPCSEEETADASQVLHRAMDNPEDAAHGVLNLLRSLVVDND